MSYFPKTLLLNVGLGTMLSAYDLLVIHFICKAEQLVIHNSFFFGLLKKITYLFCILTEVFLPSSPPIPLTLPPQSSVSIQKEGESMGINRAWPIKLQ